MLSAIFYTCILAGVSISTYVCSKSKKAEVQFVFLVISFLFLFIPSALRYDVGTDYFSYIDYFNRIAKSDWWVWENVEPLYVLTCYGIHKIGLSAQWSIAFFAFITYFLVFCAVPRRYLYIAIPMFTIMVYFFTFNGIRQAITTAGAFLATRWIIEKKYIRPFFLIIILASLHKSSLFYIPVFFVFLLFKLKPKLLALFLLIIGLVLSYTILSPSNMVEYFMSYIYEDSGSIEMFSDARAGGIGFYGRFLVYNLVFLYVVIINRKNQSNFDNIVLWGFLFILIGHSYAIQFSIFDRLLVAFNYIMAYVAIYICTTPNKYRKVVFCLLFATIWLLLYFYPVISGKQNLEYTTVFSVS